MTPTQAHGPTPEAEEDYHTIVLNRISWGAVLAGVVTALVVTLLLNMLGIGIGLTTIDPATTGSPEPSRLSITAAIWWTVSGIIAAAAGGYVAARLSGQPDSSTGGWHGFVSWALTTLVIVYLLTTSASTLIGGALNQLGALGQNATQVASQFTRTADPFTGIADEVRRIQESGASQSARESLVAAVRSAVTGNRSEAEAARARAAEALAQARGVSPEEARQQLDTWQAQYREAATQAGRIAEQTAEIAAQVALYGVIALVLGAIAAWFGGAAGGPAREYTRRTWFGRGPMKE